jgi:hypothetical protein
MADEPLVIRVAANLDTLRANLLEGVNQIETTSTAMRQMATAYDGSRAISQAGAVMAAIQAVGGVTHLTADEQTKSNAVLDAAIQKYAALGQTAPQGMQALADATKQVPAPMHEASDAATALLGTLGSLAAAAGFAFSIGAAVEFLHTITEEAHSLQVLSLQTQINVEDLQVLAGATREYGLDATQLGHAIFQLSQRIAGGDASVVTGLALMGLSLDDVKNKHGEELFLLVENAAGKLHGTIRDTAMADLYGAKLGSSLGALSTGIGEAMDKAKALDTVMSKEAVQAAAEYANAIDRASHNLHALATELIGPVAQGFNVVAEAVERTSKWAVVKAMLQDFAGSSVHAGADVSHLATLLDHLNQVTDQNAKSTGGAADQHKQIVVALTEEQQHTQFLATLRANASQALTAQNLRDLAELKSIGELDAKNAAGIGVNAAQFEKYKAGIEAAKKATEDLKKAEEELNATTLTVYQGQIAELKALEAQRAKSYGTAEQIAMLDRLDQAEDDLTRHVLTNLSSEKDRTKVVIEGGKTHEAITTQKMTLEEQLAKRVNAAVLTEFDAQVKLNAAHGETAAGAIRIEDNAWTVLQKTLDKIHAAAEAGISQKAQEQTALEAYNQTVLQEAQADDLATAAELRGTDAAKGHAAALVSVSAALSLIGGHQADKAELDTWNRSAAGIRQNQVNASDRAMHGSVDMYAPGRASGGDVRAGQPYTVGEHGPELFVPQSAGAIQPNGGGGPTFTITVNGATGADHAALAQRIKKEIMAALPGRRA